MGTGTRTGQHSLSRPGHSLSKARTAPLSLAGRRGEEKPAPSEGGFILLGLTAGDWVCGRDGRVSAARPLRMISASEHVSAIAALPSFSSASGNQA